MNMTKVADALRALADALEDRAPASETKQEKVEKPKPYPKQEQSEVKTEAVEAASLEDMIQALQKVAKVCGRAKIDEILAEFNVKKAGQVAESDRADVILLAKKAVEEAS